jgi:hypothetical protein
MVNTTIASFTAALLLLVTAEARGPPAQGGERHVLLTNDARQPIVEIYVSDDDGADWQTDLLGADLLAPGQSVLVDIDDRNGNCRVNLKTVFDDGSDHVDRGVRVCLDDGHAVPLR